MRRRYDHYCAEVVAPFYRDHFSRFDRQVVLIDLLSTLNRGPACFADLQATLDMVMRSFRYGSSSLLARIHRVRANIACLMLVGHDPGMHGLAVELSGEGRPEDLQRLANKFPTAGLAILTFKTSQWSQVKPKAGRLVTFTSPRRLS